MYYAGQVGKRLPVPILQAIDSFIIFGILLLIERYYSDRPVGFVLAATMALWGLTRFYEERLWLGEIGHLGSVLVQGAGLLLFVVGPRRDGAALPPPRSGRRASRTCTARRGKTRCSAGPPRGSERAHPTGSSARARRRRGRSVALARGPSGPGRAGERLRDGEPFRRQCTLHRQCRVGQVPALGHDETEVERGSLDQSGAGIGVPLPPLPCRSGELDPHRVGGDVEAAHDVREGPGPDPEVGDVTQSRRGKRASRPAHRRCPGRVPTSPSAAPRRTTTPPWEGRTTGPGRGGEEPRLPAPCRHERGATTPSTSRPARARPRRRCSLHGIAPRRQRRLGLHRERGGIDDRHGGGIVEERQVAHLVTHRPPRGGGRQPPRRLVERGEHPVEVGMLGLQIGEQAGQCGGIGRHRPIRLREDRPTRPGPSVENLW